MYQKIVTYFFITCIALITISCKASTSVGTSQQHFTASAATVTPEPIPHFGIGQPADVGNIWTITLTGAHVVSGSSFPPPTDGNVYLVIALTFKNRSTQTQTLSTAYSLSLTDSNGEQYNQALVANLDKIPDGDIAAGSIVDGQLVYTVPQVQHVFVLSFQNDAALPGSVIWDITAS